MRIDSHQHFWKYNDVEYGWMDDSMSVLRRDHLPAELKKELDGSGIAGSVAVQARQVADETSWLLRLAGENEFIKGVVGWVDLRADGVEEELAGFSRDKKLKGVRHVLHDEEDERFMLRDDFLNGIGKLEQFNLTYDILIFERHLKCACEFVGKFEAQPFVVDHIAKPLIKDGVVEPWRSDLRKLAEFGNVYCKLSGMVTEAAWDSWTADDLVPYMDAVLEAFGADRVMFGSDWPVCTVAASYEHVAGIVAEFVSGLSAGEQAMIMGQNAMKFYGLEE